MTKVITQKLDKVEYTHLEPWIDNLQGLESLTKCAIKQQIIVREQEIFNLKDKLSRRNMQIKDLKIQNQYLIEYQKNTLKLINEYDSLDKNTINSAYQYVIGNLVNTQLNKTFHLTSE